VVVQEPEVVVLEPVVVVSERMSIVSGELSVFSLLDSGSSSLLPDFLLPDL